MRKTVAVLSLFVTLGHSVHAGIIEVGPLYPFSYPNVSDGVTGIAFDGSSDPVVLDRWAWTLTRVSVSDASLLSVQPLVPGSPGANGPYHEGLAFDRSGNSFYTLVGGERLARIEPVAGVAITAPFGVATPNLGIPAGLFLGFQDVAIDASGGLWLGGARSGQLNYELWSVDPASGIGTLRSMVDLTPLSGGAPAQVHAMTIGPEDTFLVAASLNHHGAAEWICEVDPLTGLAIPIVPTGIINGPLGVFLTSLTYDPASQRYYGIREDRTAAEPVFSLVEITGIERSSAPDSGRSSTMLALALGAVVIVFRSCREIS